MINYDDIFTLYYGDIEELEFGTLLECIVKEGIKLLSQYIKLDTMLCDHKDTIFIYCNNILICFISPSEYIMIRRTPYHFYFYENIFK